MSEDGGAISKELPKKIKLGVRDIEIHLDEMLSPARNILSTGHVDLAYIIIQASLPFSTQIEFLFQGIIWSITCTTGIKLSSQDKRRMGMNVFAIIRNNPDLLQAELAIAMPVVRILSQNWSLVWESSHYDFAGLKVQPDNTIHLNSAYTGSKVWLTLWHEILHVVWDKLEFEADTDDEERDVELVAFMLCTLLSENDMSWITECQDLDKWEKEHGR